MKLSEAEIAALETLKEGGGSILVTKIPEKNGRGVFGVEPGIGVYKKLEKKGLLFFTIVEPMDDGFMFTQDVYITDEGLKALEER